MSESARVDHAKPPALSPIGDGKVRDIYLYGALFAGAVASFCLEEMTGGRFGLTSDIIAIAGDATCGWSWLVVRALFRKPADRREAWPLVLVLMLVATGGLLRFQDPAGPLRRVIGNVETLVSSTLLLLAVIEPLTGLYRGIPPAERRFRLLFSTGYAALLAIAVIGIDGSPSGSFAARYGGLIKIACALLALAGIGSAVWYRRRNPVPQTHRARPRVQRADEAGLGERLLRLIGDEAVYTLPDLRVAELARRAGTAEYKVTLCITGVLGFRNFNHMANHFRIEAAKAKLADIGLDHLPILTVALDCGFGSIGPFNRAFKEETGMTPMRFRETCRATNKAR